MGYYNWEKIFKEKTDKELLKIFRGDSFLDLEARCYAYYELQRREVTIGNTESIINSIVDSLRLDIIHLNNFEFRHSKQYRAFIISIVVSAILIIVLAFKGREIYRSPDDFVNVISMFVAALFGIGSGYVNYFLYKKELRKRIGSRKKHLVELLSISGYTGEQYL